MLPLEGPVLLEEAMAVGGSSAIRDDWGVEVKVFFLGGPIDDNDASKRRHAAACSS